MSEERHWRPADAAPQVETRAEWTSILERMRASAAAYCVDDEQHEVGDDLLLATVRKLVAICPENLRPIVDAIATAYEAIYRPYNIGEWSGG